MKKVEELALVVGEKYGRPLYTKNPSIPDKSDISRIRKTEIGDAIKGAIINEETGEVTGYGGATFWESEEIDNERFVKLFVGGMAGAKNLTKAGLTVFGEVYEQIQNNPNTDEVKLHSALSSISRHTFLRGVRELLDSEFIYRTPIDGIFFVNVRYIFNGDRLNFVKMYHRKKKTKIQELEDKGQLRLGDV